MNHRNFRLYFIGHAISTLGTWVQQVALAWMIYRLTGSAALLGLSTCLALLPQLFLGPIAGAFIDRHDKRRLLVYSQSLMAMQAAVLSALALSGSITPLAIIGMSALHGVLNAVDTPLRQSLLSQLVDSRDDMANALALNASLFTSARFIGPPLAGLLLEFAGEGFCFAVNSVSFLVLIAAMLLVDLKTVSRSIGNISTLFCEGLRYVTATESVRRMLSGVLLVNVTVASYVVLLPLFAGDVFSGDAGTLGWLWGAAGLGSLLASVTLAKNKDVAQLPRLISISTLFCALALLVFSSSRNLPLSLITMVFLGFGVTVNNVGTNILLQTDTPESLRGRVVSLYTATRFGFDALGGLAAGGLATFVGAPATMAFAGAILSIYVVRMISLGRW
ncbi:MFS transporter [Pseudomonas sp. Irchel s3f7]|uniref:MFS transporter n=1 Tax=Pseudomonas sp. Irchel s3f7 TaxID=2009153 RepID=UPI0035315ADF